MSKKKEISPETVNPRDGYDNTGTQGYDSLTDDAYTGSSKNQKNIRVKPKVVPVVLLKIFQI
ncbi:MAG: hypothetical protein EOO87_05425 [Pedobacter sp.]|nr:MAG: hypothetical protein EOO87_05425 [Pedobacter sp.]